MDGRPPISRPDSSPVELHSNAPHLRIHAINIFVRDQDRSVRFYVDQLGFHLAFDALLQNGDRWIAVAPPDGSALLSLVAPSPESPDYKLIGRPTGIVFVTEDVITTYAEWCRRGVRFRFAPRLRRVKFSRKEAEPGQAGTAAAEPNRL